MIALLYPLSSNQGIQWGAKGDLRIAQNVVNLLNTFLYEVAYMRLMGLSRQFIDAPINQAEGVITSEIMDLISTYEPRATVKSVKVNSVNNDGDVIIGVVVDI